MSTLPGSGVPSMTSVLPDGGGDSSGSVWMILVGVDSYCFSFSVAVATPLSVPPEEDDGLEESDESVPAGRQPRADHERGRERRERLHAPKTLGARDADVDVHERDARPSRVCRRTGMKLNRLQFEGSKRRIGVKRTFVPGARATKRFTAS